MTKKQPTIADALHLAADKYLAANLHQYDTDIDKSMFSCNAVYDACCELGVNFGGVLVGLKNMGCDVTSDDLLKQFTVIEQVQGMRYMWLKWAALMAEEQGV
jgi:hypothetical protein